VSAAPTSPEGILRYSESKIAALTDPRERSRKLWGQSRWISEAVMSGKVVAGYEQVADRLVGASTRDGLLDRETAEANCASGWARGHGLEPPKRRSGGAPVPKPSNILLECLRDAAVRDELRAILAEAIHAANAPRAT
jgi:hypothetical protein